MVNHEKDCVRKGTPETEGTTQFWRHNNVLPLEAFRLYFRLVGVSSVPTIPSSWYRRMSLEEQSVGTAGPVDVQSARCEFHPHLGISRSGLLCALIFIEAVIWYLRKASRAQQISQPRTDGGACQLVAARQVIRRLARITKHAQDPFADMCEADTSDLPVPAGVQSARCQNG